MYYMALRFRWTESDRTERYSVDHKKLIIHEGCFKLTDSLDEQSTRFESNHLSECYTFCLSKKFFVLQNSYCTCTETLTNLMKTDLKNCGNGCGYSNQSLFVYLYRLINDLETLLNAKPYNCTTIFKPALETEISAQSVTSHIVWFTRENAVTIKDGIRRFYNSSCIECKSDNLVKYPYHPVACQRWTAMLCFREEQYKDVPQNYICQADEFSTTTYINLSEVTDADEDGRMNLISGTTKPSMEYKLSTEIRQSTTEYSSEIKPESTMFNKRLTSSLSSQPYDTTIGSSYRNLNQQTTTKRVNEFDIDTNDENIIIIISVIAFSSFCIMGSVVACVIIERKKGNIHIPKKEPISKVEQTNKETYQLAAEYADPKTFQDPDYADPMNICNSDYDLQMVLEDERNNTPREIYTRHTTKQGIQKSLEDTYDHLSFKRNNKGSPDFIGGPEYDKLPGIGITHNKAKRQQELYKNQTDTLLKCNTNANRCEQKKGIAAYFETEINHSKFLYDTPKKFVAETSL